jgi:hypothetical protein
MLKLSSADRIKAIKVISKGASEMGIPCDPFLANRLVKNLWSAYERAAEENRTSQRPYARRV